jgi:hypothetical protein
MTSIASTAATWAFVVFVGAGTASGQSAHEQHHPQQAPARQGMPMQPGMMGQGMGPGMMAQTPGMMGQGGMWHMGPHMMSPAEMQHMIAHMGEMMGQGGPGMMGQGGHGMGPRMTGQMPGMMGQGMMGPGMMGPGMMGMQGLRVVPTIELSTDDVRRFLERHISAHGLMHLQVGDVTQTDEDTITADVVTREGSLALRLEIDAYTGFVESVS